LSPVVDRDGRPKPIALTIHETCRVSGLGKSKVYELLAEGRLKGTKIDRRRLIYLDSLERLLRLGIEK